MTDYAEMTPKEIDSVLAPNWEQQSRAIHYMQSAEQTLKRFSTGYNADQAREGITKYANQLSKLRTEANPYEAQFAVRQWNRYFIVQNTNGHVHRGMNCSTCFDTTQYGWLPELSGCDEATMVAEYGELACTICFPDAPSMRGFGDGTSAIARYTQAERGQRAADKAARDAKKATKMLDPELQFNELGYADRGRAWMVTTVDAAKKQLRDAYCASQGYRYEYQYSDAPRVLAGATRALLAKGMTQTELDTIKARALNKAQKEGW